MSYTSPPDRLVLANKLHYIALKHPEMLVGIAAVVDAFYEKARRDDPKK